MFRNMIVHLDIYYDGLIMDGKLVMSVKSKTVNLTTTESLSMCAFHFLTLRLIISTHVLYNNSLYQLIHKNTNRQLLHNEI